MTTRLDHPWLPLRAATTFAAALLLSACATVAPPPKAPMPEPFPPASLPGAVQSHVWDVTSAVDSQGRAAAYWRLDGRAPVRLQFDKGQLLVRNLCNAVGAAYQLDGHRIQLARPTSTLRACPDSALMALEQQVLAQLPGAQRLDLLPGGASQPRMVLHFGDGSRWELAGTPTPQTLYGSAGERLFLEVAPQRAACSHGVMKGAQCLRVREIRYSADGVKQSEGPWSLFYDEIQGFAHESGTRTVLRVNRFKRQNVPADASAYAYVLDMVVETETVR
ncbi:META and DUF4377 domain-containing protein [Acidovorax sp. sif1233]|nr:META and DUF4377 domain-containing protein [Acidovorax sp. sif1233]